MSDDRELLEAIAADMIPTDVDAVARAERRLDHDGASDTAPQRRGGALPPVRPMRWLSHGAAIALGAAATYALMAGRLAETDPPVAGVGSDPATASSAPAPKTKIALSDSCEACCAGSACASPKDGLQICSSGRSCVGCDIDKLKGSRYRLRIGAVAPAPLARDVLDKWPEGKAQICVRAGMSDEVCVDTLITEREGGRWTRLPMVVSAEDLAAKLFVRLRWKGVSGPKATAASWTMPVALTAKSLCHGYAVKLVNQDKDELFGALSLFIDDTHFVEVLRAPDIAALRTYHDTLELVGLKLTIHQAADGFVLAAGPFDLPTAEQVRWSLLRHVNVSLTVGSDYIGAPLVLE